MQQYEKFNEEFNCNISIEKFNSLLKEINKSGKEKILEGEVILEENPLAAQRPRVRLFGKAPIIYSKTSEKKFKKKLLEKFLEVFNIDDTNFNIITTKFKIEIVIYKKILKNFTILQKIMTFLNKSYVITKPDVDNYAKIILDALNGHIFIDDALCYKLTIEKKYSLDSKIYVKIIY